jgi:hypothetical protein
MRTGYNLRQDLDKYRNVENTILANLFKTQGRPCNEEPEELIRYAALIHNSVMTATSTAMANVMPCE